MTSANDLLVSIRQITRAIDLHSKQLAKKSGLTVPQLMVLQSLSETGRAKPSDIARQVFLSQATVTSIVDRLARAGLITRERSAEDRRVLEVVLSRAGRDRLNDAPKLLQEGFLSKFDELQPWEQTQLLSALQRIAFMMNATGIDAAPILEVGDLHDGSAP